jgi:hypothetical protein
MCVHAVAKCPPARVAIHAGRDPAAQGRELERLREVAERQPVLGELILQARPERAGLDPRRPRDAIDLHDISEAAHVDADGAAISVAHPGLDAADHASPAAVGNRRQLLLGAPAQDLLEVALIPRMRHQVRRVIDLAAKAADHVAIGLAERVADPLVGVGAELRGKRGWGVHPRRPELDRLQRDGVLDVLAAESQPVADPRRRRLDLAARHGLVLVPPAPVLSPAQGALYQ